MTGARAAEREERAQLLARARELAAGRWGVQVGQPSSLAASDRMWPVPSALSALVPGGLPRGATVAVSGSISLLLATLGAASAQGAWCAVAGLPSVGAEAAAEFGLVLERTPVVSPPPSRLNGGGWAGLIAALVDAVDVIAARPTGCVPGADLARLAARTRSKDATLILYAETADTAAGDWPGADLRLHAAEGRWRRAGGPRGRLVARQLSVTAAGRGRYARPRSAELWLPASGGGVESAGQQTIAHEAVSAATPSPRSRPRRAG